MEKHFPHYALMEIQAQMTSVTAINLTESARVGIRGAGMGWADALAVVHGLRRRDFYKSMTTHRDHRVWQDVYHGCWRGTLAASTGAAAGAGACPGGSRKSAA